MKTPYCVLNWRGKGFSMKRKKIEFVPLSEEAYTKLNPPQPGIRHVPDWYKKSNRFIGGEMEVSENGLNKDLKLCHPFLDAMTAGYMYELSSDLIVDKKDGAYRFVWADTPRTVQFRSKDMAKLLPRPAGHARDMFAWVMPFGPKTPPGYSCLVTHPLNRWDLPFTTTSGIMESDNYSVAGEVPFFFKNDFEGIISAGTPLFQVIPFKRENWTSSKIKFDETGIMKQMHSIHKTLYGGYKKLYWVKKSFE